MRHRKIRAQMKNVLFYRYFGMVLLKNIFGSFEAILLTGI